MSKSVDQRVVEMQFDNAKFEKNVKSTMDSIDKLNEKLKFDGVEEGLSNITKLNKGFDLGGISDAVESVAERFSTLGIVGMRVLENLTDKAVDFGLKFVKSVSIDPVMDGWSKYETTNRNTVTVMNQTGASIDEATKYLDKLGYYADYTSFNMNAMTSALSAFTTQGIPLEKAIPAIMGIGNSVTYAGKSAQESANAFQIYSKVMASGMDLQSWKQLSRTWSYAGTEMKWQFLEAAEAAGTLEKAGDGLWKIAGSKNKYVTFETFDETLKDDWLSAEVALNVFSDTYGKFADGVITYAQKVEEETGRSLTYDQAVEEYIAAEKAAGHEIDEMGQKYLDSATLARTYADAVDAVKDAVSSLYADIFKSIFGDVEKATKFWTEFSEILNALVTGPLSKFADFVSGLSENGVFGLIWNTIKIAADRIKQYLAPIKDAFNSVFGDLITKDWVTNVTDLIRNFSLWVSNLRPSEKYLTNMKDIFTGIFSVFKILGTMIGDVTQVTKPLGTVFKKVGGTIIEVLGAIGRLLSQVEPFIKSTYDSWLNSDLFFAIKGPFKNLEKSVTVAFDTIKAFVEKIGTEGFKLDSILDFIGGSVGLIAGTFSELFSQLTGWDTSKFNASMLKFGEDIRNKVTVAIEYLDRVIKNTFGEDATVFDIIGAALDGFITIVGKVGSTIGKWAKAIKEGLETMFAGETMDKAATSANFLTAISDKLTAAFDKIKQGLSWLWEQIKIFFGGQITLESVLKTLKDIAHIIITLNLSKALSSVTGFFDGLSETLNRFARAIKPAGKGIKMAAAGILMIAGAMVILASLKPEALHQAIGGLIAATMALSVLVAVFSKFDKGASKFKFNLKDMFNGNKLDLSTTTTNNISMSAPGLFGKYSGLVGMAIAIMLVSKAIATIAESSASREQIQEAAVITTLTFGVIGFMNAIFQKYGQGGGKGYTKDGGKGLLLMAVSMFVIAKAFAAFGELKPEEYSRGKEVMISLLGSLLLMTAIAGITKGDVNFQPKAFLTMSTALAAMAFAIKALGEIPPEQVQQGYTALVIMTSVIGAVLVATGLVAHKLSSSGSEFDAIGKAFLKMSVSMLIVAGAIKLMSTVGDTSMVASVLSIAGIIIVFTGALAGLYALTAKLEGGESLNSIAKSFVTLSAAMLVLSAAFFVMGKADKIGPSIGAMIAMLVALSLAAAVMKANGLTEQFNALSKTFLSFGVALGAAAIALTILSVALVPFVAQLLAAVPMIIAIIGELILGLTVLLPMIVGLITAFIASVLDAIVALMPKLRAALWAIVDTIVEVFIAMIPKIAYAIVFAIWKILDVVNTFAAAIAAKLLEIVINIISGLANAIIANRHKIVQTIQDALAAVITLILTFIGELIADGLDMLFDGAGNGVRRATDGLAAMVAGEISAVNDRIPASAIKENESVGVSMGQSIADGVQSMFGTMNNTSSEFAGIFQWPFNDLIGSGSLFKIGESLGFNVQDGLNGFINTGGLTNSAEKLGQSFVATLEGPKIKKAVRDAAGNIVYEYREASEAEIYNAGVDTLVGLLKGLKDRKSLDAINRQASHVGLAVATTLRNTMEIESPSRVTMEIGRYVDEGLAIGLRDYIPTTEAEEVGNGVLDALKAPFAKIQQLLDGELDLSPTIKPVMDLSELKRGLSEANTLTGSASLSTAKIYNTASSVAPANSNQNVSKPVTSSVTYNFNQTNVSPSPLNRTEIYRQTSNQFAAFKSTTINSGGGKNVQMAR